MDKILKTAEVAKLLNVHIRTVQRWDREQKLVAHRFASGHRYYLQSQIDAFYKRKGIAW